MHEDDESKDIADTLVTDTFTVVGSGSYAWYLNFDRGTADIGNGDVRFFLMVPPESFALEAYTVIYATTDGADGMICYDQGYKDYVGGIEDRIELLEDARCRARYDEVQQEGADKIADAKQQIADGEKELQDAKDKLADAKVQLDDAAQTIADGEKEIESSHHEFFLIDFCAAFNDDMTLLVEHPGDAAGVAHAVAVFVKQVADFRSGTVAVVSQNFDNDCNAAGAVTLVSAAFVVNGAEFACRLFDGAGDVVVGHVACLCFCNNIAEF